MTPPPTPTNHAPVYLDYCATTPVDPRVLEKMLPFFNETFGNASSRNHQFGWDAADAVENARSAVADLVHAQTSDIIFTSGATESINLAIKAVAEAFNNKGNHIITTTVEHHAVLSTCRHLEQTGFDITWLEVDTAGRIDLQSLEDAIRPSTVLITVMHSNNETGVIFPIAEIGRIARSREILFFTDATQSAGKVPIDFTADKVDMAAFSGHKLYGPKGAGCLYISNMDLKKKISPQQHGGGQEFNLRSGTLNVPAIVGFGEACRIAISEMGTDEIKSRFLRDLLEHEIRERIVHAEVNGNQTNRLPHVSNISFPGVQARELIRQMGSIAVATTAACSSGISKISHVLKAMGKTDVLIDGAIRFSCGRFSTEEEIWYTVERLAKLGSEH